MNTSPVPSFTAGEAITQYKRVKISTSGKVYVAGATDDAIGVAAYHDADPDIKGRDTVAVQRFGTGIQFAIAGGVIAAGAQIQAAAGGKVVTQASGQPIGVAHTAAAGDGSVILVLYYGGGIDESKATLTAGATPSFAPGNAINLYTLTPAENETLAGVVAGAVAGRTYRLEVVTSGTSSYTLTFGANFKSTGTLATGTSDAKTFIVSFVFDGTNFVETGRTTAM